MNDPMDLDWRERISQPQYRTVADKRLRAPMRDGVELAVDVFRPDAGERVPALLAYGPYWNEGQYLPVPRGNPHPHAGWGNFAIECGDTDYLVSRGYAHVIANVRGTGESGGEFQLMGALEARDGYDLIEWIAAQPWCNGCVGMVGVSYFSWIQYLVAAQQPPALKAIFPLEGAGDFYRDVCYHGGILSLGFLWYWSTEITDNRNVAQSEREFSPAELHRRIEAVKRDNDDIKQVYALYHLLCAPKRNPLLFDALMHPTDGPWYHERSAYTHLPDIAVPTWCGAPLDFFDLHLPGGFSAWEGLDGPPKKFLIYPRFHERPFHEDHDLIVRWYDHWLKDRDTGLMDEPPIRLWVQGRNLWRSEQEWPLARTEWRRLYLRQGGLLSWDAPSGEETPDAFRNIAYLSTDDLAQPLPQAIYRTAALATDLELTGPMALVLHAALDDTDGHWIAEIHDRAPDGARRLVTRGWLKASFREIDPARSKPWRPWHPFTRQTPVPPGEVCEYAIRIHDNCNVFLAGHRLELIVKSLDHSLEGGWNTIFYHLPCARAVTHTLHHSAAHPSHLLVPVIPG
jgi:predicted acyl esterase